MDNTKRNKRPSLGDLTGQAPPTASLAHDTVRELTRLSTPGGAESLDSEPRPPAAKAVEAKPARRAPRKGATFSDDDLRQALLADAEVESVWTKFATQIRIETRERLNAYVLHGKRKRFNSTRIQDVVDAALCRYLDEEGFTKPQPSREAA